MPATGAGPSFADFSEEVIALVIYQNKGGEVFHFNFPDSFHTQFRIFHTLNALDIILSKDSSRTTNRAQIETAILLTSIRYLLATITFCQHYHATAM